jgi:hypothetical protein
LFWTRKLGQYPAKSEAGHGSEGSIADMGTYHKAIELSERHLEECRNTIQVLWLRSGGVLVVEIIFWISILFEVARVIARGSAANHSRPALRLKRKKL